MKLAPSITVVPFLHGNAHFSWHVRRVCAEDDYDCIAVDLPAVFGSALVKAIDDLPFISAAIARGIGDPLYYLPADPCDAAIEAVRQGRQRRAACRLIGYPVLGRIEPLPPLPDAYAIERLGFDAYVSLCLRVIGNRDHGDDDVAAQYIAHELHDLRIRHKKILALVHLKRFVRTVFHFGQERSHNLSFGAMPAYAVESEYVNPDHLYFALGELPFVTGKIEQERHDALAAPPELLDTIKDLFRETREDYYDRREEITELSPARIQAGLTFLRNLTVASGAFVPSLIDIVAAAKGVGGNAYALRVLKSAKYYPYLPVEQAGSFLAVGIDKIALPGDGSVHAAVNILRDTALTWRTLSIKPEPPPFDKKRYRFAWNPSAMCSHVPEDRRIETFNAHLRATARRALCENLVKTERFTASVKDGIDFRETLRNWFTGDVYVRELPPARGKLDTVVIIFDDAHDERYPHCATWYAEHPQESTLTFYATDPFESMVGPGIARSRYGGLSLLFPPRAVPNAFSVTGEMGLNGLAERLVYGALLFSGERHVAIVSARKPGMRLMRMAAQLKKHLVWIPLASFGAETLRRLRGFHVLNGKTVRSWASRFIAD